MFKNDPMLVWFLKKIDQMVVCCINAAALVVRGLDCATDLLLSFETCVFLDP